MADLPRTDRLGESNKSEDESLFRGVAGWIRALVPGRGEEGTVREVIEELIEDVDDDDARQIGSDESALIGNILKLHELTAEDVMVPRTDIVAADLDNSLDNLVELMAQEAHSRMPVYSEHLDEIVGFVHIKDVLAAVRRRPRVEVKDIVRDILFSSPSMRVLDLLLEMRARRTHMAIVVDEFGGVDGLVTIEDLVEEIVGEIEDEHDTDGPSIIRRPDGSILADARTEIEELEEIIGSFATEEERAEIDTLGGVVFKLIDRVPRRNEVVTHPSGLQFEIVDADRRRVKRVCIRDTRASDDD